MGLRMVRFENVRAVIFDSQSNTLRVLRETLSIIGLRKVAAHSNLETVKAAVTESPPELLILDIDDQKAAVCSLIRDIRLRKVGTNPFLVVVGTAWDGSRANVGEVLNAGADDLLLKPMSVDFVQSRITNLVHQRKAFVATPGYIGPDRRTSRGIDAAIVPLLEVPNTLRLCAADSPALSADEMTAETTRASRAVGVQQVARFAVHLRNSAAKLAGETLPNESKIWVANPSQLESMLVTMREQLEAQMFADLVVMLDSAAEHLRKLQSGAPTPKQIELLRLHSDGIFAALRENKELPDEESPVAMAASG